MISVQLADSMVLELRDSTIHNTRRRRRRVDLHLCRGTWTVFHIIIIHLLC